jgi:ferredoxin
MIRIVHHRAKCIGCGYCEDIAPYRWRMDLLDGKVNLIGSVEKKDIHIFLASDDEIQENQEIAELCPVKIIQIEVF